MKLDLIRHGKTKGNLEGRYVGKTDESLCREGRMLLEEYAAGGKYEAAQLMFCSPMKRCRETAEIIAKAIHYEDPIKVISEFTETDFGVFEYKNYEELNGNPVYQSWIDSNGTMEIPGAESKAQFRMRLKNGFEQLLDICFQEQVQAAAVIVHGGVIMELMQLYGIPEKSYYEWQVKNGCGLSAEIVLENSINKKAIALHKTETDGNDIYKKLERSRKADDTERKDHQETGIENTKYKIKFVRWI